jgi:predicted aldo/keto reductase-like oxidoreductase
VLNSPRNTGNELDAEYVGGHIKFKNKMHTILKLTNERIDVMPLDTKEPYFSIPYKRTIAVEILSSQRGSSFLAIGNDTSMLAATAGISILTNYLVNKPKLLLVLTFTDEYNLQQSVAFQMQRVEEAQQAIYDKVAQAQRLMHNACLRCGECAPISMLRRNGGYCDFCMKG